jgi:hypothetical protein
MTVPQEWDLFGDAISILSIRLKRFFAFSSSYILGKKLLESIFFILSIELIEGNINFFSLYGQNQVKKENCKISVN